MDEIRKLERTAGFPPPRTMADWLWEYEHALSRAAAWLIWLLAPVGIFLVAFLFSRRIAGPTPPSLAFTAQLHNLTAKGYLVVTVLGVLGMVAAALWRACGRLTPRHHIVMTLGFGAVATGASVAAHLFSAHGRYSTSLSAPAYVAGHVTARELLARSDACRFSVTDSWGEQLDFFVDRQVVPAPVCRALSPGRHVSVQFAVETLQRIRPAASTPEPIDTALVLQSLRLDPAQP